MVAIHTDELNSISGDSDDTYDGLLVVDGSIIPCVLGVNPAFTITCIAERCMRLLAQDEKWTTDYSLPAVSISRLITCRSCAPLLTNNCHNYEA